MSMSRKFLTGLGLSTDQVEAVIEAHTETTDALKDQISTYKADADRLPGIQKQLDELKSAGNDGYKEKYESEHQAFEDYKAEQSAKEARAAKESAYRNLLREAGISDKRISSVMKVSDIDSVELAKDGTIKGADKLTEGIKTEWADFITTTETKGAATATPPANTGSGTMAKEDIMKIKDPVARQTAIAENLELFQKKG